MNSGEFKQVLKDLGKREVTDDQVKTMLAAHDKDGDKQISWTEFLEVREIIKLISFVSCSNN